MTDCHRTDNTSETTALLLRPSLSFHFQDKLCILAWKGAHHLSVMLCWRFLHASQKLYVLENMQWDSQVFFFEVWQDIVDWINASTSHFVMENLVSTEQWLDASHKEGLEGNVKLKGSFVCSDHEIMKFEILRAAKRAHSKLTMLEFRRGDFGLLRDLFGGVPWDKAL